jgi:HAD superfamily hydrolase (TIGR01509 family)
MLRGIKAVFVDVDGTCVDCEGRNFRALQKTAAEGGFELTEQHMKWFTGAGDGTIYRNIVDSLADRPDKQAEFQRVHPDAAAFERACVEKYYTMRDEISANQDVFSLVQAFMARNIPVAPVSNSLREVVQDNLVTTGYPVDDFPFILGKDDVEAVGYSAKPAPYPYLYAMQLLNIRRSPSGLRPLDPRQCLVIEDSQTGARAGVSAGMHTVHLVNAAANCLLPGDYQGMGAIYKPCYAGYLHASVASLERQLQEGLSFPKAG